MTTAVIVVTHAISRRRSAVGQSTTATIVAVSGLTANIAGLWL
jgi:hypothetical protein